VIFNIKNLTEVKDNFSQRIKELEMNLESLENIKYFNELDFPITESEISDAMLKIKLNKSPGLDNITNNMIRCSVDRNLSRRKLRIRLNNFHMALVIVRPL
jgi:hypothetical protein